MDKKWKKRLRRAFDQMLAKDEEQLKRVKKFFKFLKKKPKKTVKKLLQKSRKLKQANENQTPVNVEHFATDEEETANQPNNVAVEHDTAA